nr:hypothetical protein [Cryobacterium sp. M96]
MPFAVLPVLSRRKRRGAFESGQQSLVDLQHVGGGDALDRDGQIGDVGLLDRASGLHSGVHADRALGEESVVEVLGVVGQELVGLQSDGRVGELIPLQEGAHGIQVLGFRLGDAGRERRVVLGVECGVQVVRELLFSAHRREL